MKKNRYINMLAMSLLLLGAVACSSSNQQESNQQEANLGPEYTSAYVCPMHCEGSGSDTAGTCPVCGMDYVENKNNQ